MQLHVSNLGTQITDDSLNSAFAAHGSVASARIARDAFTGQPRGFGTVEMPDDAEALAAVSKLNGAVVDGRIIAVQQAPAPQGFSRGSYPARRRELK